MKYEGLVKGEEGSIYSLKQGLLDMLRLCTMLEEDRPNNLQAMDKKALLKRSAEFVNDGEKFRAKVRAMK